MVEFERDDRFGHLGKISTEDCGDVMGHIRRTFPVEVLTVL